MHIEAYGLLEYWSIEFTSYSCFYNHYSNTPLLQYSAAGVTPHLYHLQTIVRAEGHATAAVDAHERLACWVKINRIHGTSLGAFATSDAQILLDHHSASLALRKGTGGADHCTWGRITCQAGFCLKAGCHPAGRSNTDARRVPGQMLVHQPCAGQ